MGKCLVFSLWLARTTSPSNPTSPVTWYQRERHSSASKAIPCSLAAFCISRLFDSSIPLFLSIISLLSYFLVSALSAFFQHSLFLSLSSTPLPSILPFKHGRFWVCGKGLDCVARRGGSWDYRHGDPHQNSPVREGWEHVHTFPVIILQLQLEELDEKFHVNIRAESWLGQRPLKQMRMTSWKHYRTLCFYKPPFTTVIVLKLSPLLLQPFLEGI